MVTALLQPRVFNLHGHYNTPFLTVYHGAVPGLPESCCVALGQPITPATKRERLVGRQSVRSPPLTIRAMETTGEAALDLYIDVM